MCMRAYVRGCPSRECGSGVRRLERGLLGIWSRRFGGKVVSRRYVAISEKISCTSLGKTFLRFFLKKLFIYCLKVKVMDYTKLFLFFFN